MVPRLRRERRLGLVLHAAHALQRDRQLRQAPGSAARDPSPAPAPPPPPGRPARRAPRSAAAERARGRSVDEADERRRLEGRCPQTSSYRITPTAHMSGAMVHASARHHLRRQVARSAQQDAGLRQRGLTQPGDAEVEQLDGPVGQQPHVGRLHVAVGSRRACARSPARGRPRPSRGASSRGSRPGDMASTRSSPSSSSIAM